MAESLSYSASSISVQLHELEREAGTTLLRRVGRNVEDAHWATGHRGTGLDALVRNRCNLLGGYEPDVRHRSNAGYVMGAIVASGLAVSLLPILLTVTQPQVAARPVAEERLQRTIFTAVRTSSDTPAVHAVRDALRDTAAAIAVDRPEIDVVG